MSHDEDELEKRSQGLWWDVQRVFSVKIGFVLNKPASNILISLRNHTHTHKKTVKQNYRSNSKISITRRGGANKAACTTFIFDTRLTSKTANFETYVGSE